MADELRFGTYCEFQGPPGRDHSQIIWDVIALGEHCDQNGFHVFTALEHPFFEKFALNTNPLALFCTLAQRTKNLRFRALCHTLPLHNPFVLAGEIAEADILMNGRLDVGVGRGHAWLNEPANIAMEENVERYAEELDILLKAWTEDRFSYDGKYYKAKDLSVVPKPVQKPHPPIWQVGTSAKWFQRAAENGYGVALGGPAPTVVFREPAFLYQRLCEEAGTKPQLAWIKAIYLDDDEDRAHEEAREAVINFVHYNVSPMDSLRLRDTDEGRQRLIDMGYAFYAADDFPNTRNLSYEQLIEFGIVFVGTPEKVGKQLLELWDEFHFQELLIISHFGGTARWQAMKTQELFVRDIMPMLREAVAKAGPRKQAVAA
jgi:alkanesulfonate monooxygenase SsuD/methylene tetrahydromethanopterin reductase-like flavin-dependent oxidoreductase (luciferase family)